MATITKTVLLVVLLAAVAPLAIVRADSTAQSLLDCQPRQVEPSQSISCTIYVRDSLQEPTTIFQATDFYVSPIATVLGAPLSVSTPVLGSDLTTLVFTITASSGTNVAVNVYLRSTGEVIRGSGLTATVLVWPATRLGAITCTSASFVAGSGALPLRATATCVATASGNTGLPAVVHASDVYFTEDHFAGSFQFVSGATQLVFNYTAPATIASVFSAFTIHATLANSDAVYSTTIPLAYPQLAPTPLSSLQCTGQTSPMCFVSAQDNAGPVLFNASNFVFAFEKLDATNSAWLSSTSTMNLTLASVATAGANVERVLWSLLSNNEISTQRLRVFLSIGSSSKQQELVGSPYVFTSGQAPTPSYVSLRGCQQLYIAAANATLCTIDLLNGVTGDPRYYTITTTTGGACSGLTYGSDPITLTPVMTFTYTAPMVALRTEDRISVSVAGGAVLNTPIRIVVYPTSIILPPSAMNTKLPGTIALGLLFYGTCLAIGLNMFCKRQSKIRKIQTIRAEREREEMMRRVQGIAEEHHTYATAHTIGASSGLRSSTRSPSQDSAKVDEKLQSASSVPAGGAAPAAVPIAVGSNSSASQPPSLSTSPPMAIATEFITKKLHESDSD